MIELNINAESPSGLFLVSTGRAAEMIETFLAKAKATMQDIDKKIEDAQNGATITFDFFPLIGEYLAVAKNESEQLFATYCASGAVAKLNEYAERLLNEANVISNFFR